MVIPTVMDLWVSLGGGYTKVMDVLLLDQL